MKILGKVEIFMTTLVAGKVATVEDSLFMAKINYSPCFKFQKLTIRSTSLFAKIILRQVEIVLILYAINLMVRKKNEIIRSFVRASWPCQHHITCMTRKQSGHLVLYNLNSGERTRIVQY